MKKFETHSVISVIAATAVTLMLATTSAAIDPGTWSARADLPEDLYFAAVAEADGILYTIGGSPSLEVVDSVFSYNPVADTWLEGPAMITPRSMAAVAVVDGKIYVFGGALDSDDWTATNVVEAYDPVHGTWEAKTSMPIAYWGSAAVASDGKVFVIGGGTGDVLGQPDVYSSVQVYDPSADSWDTATDMPTARATATAGVTAGKIYALGGSLEDRACGAMELYDPATDTWATAPDMPTPRDWFASAVVDDKVYALGGLAWGANVDLRIVHEIEVFNPQTNKWALSSRMPDQRFGLGAAVINDSIFMVGGANRIMLSATDHVDNYDPDLFSYWAEAAAHLSGAHGSVWQTDVCAANLNGGDANITMTLHTDTGSNSEIDEIGAGQQKSFPDIVGEMGISGKGALEVRSDQPLRLAGRTFSGEDTGTFGQFCDFLSMEKGFFAGEEVWLIGLRQDSLFRTNLSFANTGIREAVLYVSLFRCSGEILGTFAVDIDPAQLDQRLEPFINEVGEPDLGWGYARVIVVSGAGVRISASLIDSRTNDSTTLLATR